MSWFIGTPVGPAYYGFFHVLMFWLVVPVLFGAVAALVPKRSQE
jgi:hypothetical protein